MGFLLYKFQIKSIKIGLKLKYINEKEVIQVVESSSLELRGIKSYLDRYVDGYQFDPLFKNKLWNGKRTSFNKEENTFPLGLWQEAYKCCVEFGYSWNFVNKEEFPLNRKIKKVEFEEFIKEFFNGFKMSGKDFVLRDYQIRAAFNILKNRYCNISVATSGGKTLIYSLVLFYLMSKYPNKKFLLVVPSKTLVTQFYDDVQSFNWRKEIDLNIQEIFGEEEKPRIMDNTREPNFVIATFQSLTYEQKIPDPKARNKTKTKTISKFPKEWFKQFWSVTVDEAHRGKSMSYSKKILKYTLNNAYYRWGMSGSFPKDNTHEMAEIMKNTGPVVDIVKARELMDLGYITKVKIKGVLMHHNDWEFTQALETIATRDKKSAYDLECEKIQDSVERLSVINQIVSKCKSNTLVLFHNVEYGKKILDYLTERNPDKDFHFINGSISNKKRTPIKKLMENTDDRVQVLVASFGTLSTGVSINAINNVIFTQSFKKEQVIIQSIGRALRLHKDKDMAYIFDLVDIFEHDNFANKVKRKFDNVLKTHWIKRTKIYDEEEYPYSTIDINLKPNE